MYVRPFLHASLIFRMLLAAMSLFTYATYVYVRCEYSIFWDEYCIKYRRRSWICRSRKVGDREYGMICRGPGFLSFVTFGSSPTPSPFSHQQVVSLWQSFSCVFSVELTDLRGGSGGRRESRVLYKSFTTPWLGEEDEIWVDHGHGKVQRALLVTGHLSVVAKGSDWVVLWVIMVYCTYWMRSNSALHIYPSP